MLRLYSMEGSCASAVSRSASVTRNCVSTRSRRAYSRLSSARSRAGSGNPSPVRKSEKSMRERRNLGSTPRIPCPKSNPLMRLICAVRSRISRWRSRCERRASSSSMVGTRTIEQTCRSPPVDSDQRPQEHQHIDPVGLHTTCPAIDLQTGRIENPAVDLLSVFNERAGQKPS